MWRNLVIPTSGSRLLEGFIFPTTPQRWDCCPRAGQPSLCALDYMQPFFLFFPGQSARGGSSLSASQMESTMKLLRGRLLSRQALTKQFASLGGWDSVGFSGTVQRFSSGTKNVICPNFPPLPPQSTASSQSPASASTSSQPRSCPAWPVGPPSPTKTIRWDALCSAGSSQCTVNFSNQDALQMNL